MQASRIGRSRRSEYPILFPTANERFAFGDGLWLPVSGVSLLLAQERDLAGPLLGLFLY